jgi:diguanylate cyclase (GGDEF)-like protein
LLLYLTLKQEQDREKFFKRVASLNHHISQAKAYIPAKQLNQFRSLAKTVKHQGETIFDAYDKALPEDLNYQDKRILIGDFHQNTSAIRKLGVALVEESAQALNDNRSRSKQALTYHLYLFSTSSLLLFLFLIYLTYQSGKIKVSQEFAKKLESYAYTDALTQLPNRRKFNETLAIEWQRAIRNKTELSVLYIDIDFFKKYNDTYGHQAGDLCLAKVAQALKLVIKRPADLICRYGGEEFIVLLPETVNPLPIAKQMLQAVEGMEIAHESSNVADHITISVGAYTCTADTCNDSEQLLKRADNALYRAKQNGRKQIFVYHPGEQGEAGIQAEIVT